MVKGQIPRKTRSNVKFTPPFVIFIIIFALLGSYFIFRGHAATFADASEAESGTISGNASTISDVSASNSSTVKFGSTTTANATNPCVHSPKPAQWKHVVVLFFENRDYSEVIGNAAAPYISGLAQKCANATSWYDADFRSPGVRDGNYNSKPNYATYTTGVSPSVHGLLDDTYSTKTSVDNIFRQLRHAGKVGKAYYDAAAPGCTTRFSGDYHDPLRYFNGDNGADAAYCTTNDEPLPNFWTDLNSNTLPDFSVILPTNDENMHNDTTTHGDTWASNFLPNFFNSARYKSGDTAFFFLWDENEGTTLPNVEVAPSIKPGATVPATSHFGATRTWDEMLGLPYLGVTNTAPHPTEDLLATFNGQ